MFDVFGQVGDALNEGLTDALFGGQLDKLIAEKPEAVKEILLSWESETRKFIDQNGQILRDALRKQLTIGEKFALMAKLWIAENVSELMKDQAVETSDFGTTVARVKTDGSATMLGDKNIFWPTVADGLFGSFTMLMNLKGKAPTGSTLIVPKSEEIMGLDVSAALRAGLLKHGIDLKSYSISENIPTPGEKEIQLITVPAESLPMKGEAVDVEAVKAYAKLFERGKVQWFTNPLLMAAVMVVREHDATKVDAIMSTFGLTGEDVKAQLSALTA